MPLWLIKPYSRRQLTREERIANYRRQEGDQECLWHISGQIHGSTDDHGASPRVVRDIVLILWYYTACSKVMLLEQTTRLPTLADDSQPPQADQADKGPYENHVRYFTDPTGLETTNRL